MGEELDLEQSEIDKWLNRYPEMIYRKESDDFVYQDIELVPFMWGMRLPDVEGFLSCEKCNHSIPKFKPIEGSLFSYGLRHKELNDIWLFDYDTPEKMWSQFLCDIARRQFESKKYNQEPKPWWKRAIGL